MLYHGTGYDRLSSIMNEGLKPTTKETLTNYTKRMGYGRCAVGEVHMTTEKKFAEFFAIAGHSRESANILLKISTKGLDKDKFEIYPLFHTPRVEYRYTGEIPPGNISSVEEVTPIADTWHIDSERHTAKEIDKHLYIP